MWLRRFFFYWVLAAAFYLPLWLFVSWILFAQSVWALLWILMIAIPAVFISELVLGFLVRIRPSVRKNRAASWWDVLGFTVWHLLVISLGFFAADWWFSVFLLAILAALCVFWLEVWQLVREVRTMSRMQKSATITITEPPPSTGQ